MPYFLQNFKCFEKFFALFGGKKEKAAKQPLLGLLFR
jgi:hypothetical protein